MVQQPAAGVTLQARTSSEVQFCMREADQAGSSKLYEVPDRQESAQLLQRKLPVGASLSLQAAQSTPWHRGM